MAKRKPTEEEITASIAAAENGDVAEVRKMLDAGVSPNAAGQYGNRPLIKAAQKDREDVFFLLLEAGADWRLGTLRDSSALVRAAARKTPSRLRMVERMLWKGLVDVGHFDDLTPRPDRGIRKEWFHAGWAPPQSGDSRDTGQG